jgi:hypothetical protein
VKAIQTNLSTNKPIPKCYTPDMVIELPTLTATRLEHLRRSLGKSRVEALDFALKNALEELEAEQSFRAPNPHAQGYSDADIMSIATAAVKADRKKHHT